MPTINLFEQNFSDFSDIRAMLGECTSDDHLDSDTTGFTHDEAEYYASFASMY